MSTGYLNSKPFRQASRTSTLSVCAEIKGKEETHMRYICPEILTTRQASSAIQGGIPKLVGNNDAADMHTSAAGYDADE